MWKLVGHQRVVAGEGLAEGVDRRGADVAENDPDRADRDLVQRALVAVRTGLPGLRLRRAPVAVMFMC